MRKSKLFTAFCACLLTLAAVLVGDPSAFATWSAPASAGNMSIASATMPAPSGLTGTLSTLDISSIEASAPFSVQAITCLSASLCWAAGESNSEGAVATWNGGTSWSAVENVPNTTKFLGVSCVPDESFCMAVGFYTPPNPVGAQYAVWATWSSSSNVYSLSNILEDQAVGSFATVSCASSTTCVAPAYVPSALGLAVWNGTSASGDVSTWDMGGWSAVGDTMCLSASLCWAVGYEYVATGNIAEAAMWNGSTWAMPGLPGVAEADDVTCSSDTSCWTIGSTSSGSPVATQWNGSSWSSPPVAISVTNSSGSLGLSCNSGSLCWSVMDVSGTLTVVSPSGLSLTWTPPADSLDALDSPLVAAQQVVSTPYSGSTCGTTWSYVSTVSTTTSSDTISSPANSSCYSVRTVNADGDWTSTVPPGVVG